MSERFETLDSCAVYGRPAVPTGRPYLTPGELLADMDRLGIAETWCCDWRALEAGAMEGNRLLAAELAGQPRLHPVWTLLPPATGEMPAPERLLDEMAAAGVSLVRAEPERHGYSPAEWCCGGLWAALERRRVPVMLVMTSGWDALAAVLAGHPGLPVILSGAGYRIDRVLYPLLDRHANLYVETSTYLVNEGLRTVAQRFGAARLIFGSGSPGLCLEAAVGTLRFSGLGPDDAAAAAGGNLRGLLSGVRR